MPATIPLTVIGGYLGAGKTTLINHLLRTADGRRIAVIVNDFGSLAIDADLLAGAVVDDDVIALANGCVCCTVGSGLHDALTGLTSRPEPPDHVVIEVSGVADPAAAAAWGTVAPFEPAGVIVLADATDIVRLAADKYVGVEVRRQLAGADLVAVTKSDRCTTERWDEAVAWIDRVTAGAPRITVVDGRVPAAVVLGMRTESGSDALGPIGGGGNGRGDGDGGNHRVDDDGGNGGADGHGGHGHGDRYESWSWSSPDRIGRDRLDGLLASLPPEVLRLKGMVRLDEGGDVVVQRVGRHTDLRAATVPVEVSHLVAIGLRGDRSGPSPFASLLD